MKEQGKHFLLSTGGTCFLSGDWSVHLELSDRSVLLSLQALCRLTRHSPTAFQNVIEKVGLTSVINSLASAICKIQQYLLTLFTAMLSCGIHLQRLIQEKV